MLKKDLNTKQVGNLFGVDESTVRSGLYLEKSNAFHQQVVIENFLIMIL